jgi:signal transduction histidine kinase
MQDKLTISRSGKDQEATSPEESLFFLAWKLRRLVKALVVVMVAVLSILAVYFWSRTEQTAVNNFYRNSAMLAKLGARRAEQILAGVESIFDRLYRIWQGGDLSAVAWNKGLADIGALSLVVIDSRGGLQSIGGLESLQPAKLADSYHAWCRAENDLCFGKIGSFPSMGDMHLAFLARRNQDGAVLVLLLDWLILAKKIVNEVSLEPEGLAWLLDGKGRLLYHPASPDVCNESKRDTDARCAACHKKARPNLPELPQEATTGDLAIEGTPRKLVAFSRIVAFQQSWVLGLGVPYQAVVGEYRKVLRLAVLISGILISLFMLVTYLLDRENRRQLFDLHQERQAVAKLNRELEEKIQERTARIEQLYNELAEFRKRHDNWQRLAIVGELAAVVAHETRNPLNAMAIGTERLLRIMDTGGAPDVKKMREIALGILAEIRRIGRFVDEYLRLARYKPRNLKLLDLCQPVREIGRFIGMEAQRQKVDLKFDLPPEGATVEVDPEQIRQLLLNLVINSLQAMPNGGRVFIRVNKYDESVILEVEDDGPGIPADHIKKIFEPFFSTRENGTGLGLAICKRIVQENGGRIECHSEVGHGTTFRCVFPAATQQTA